MSPPARGMQHTPPADRVYPSRRSRRNGPKTRPSVGHRAVRRGQSTPRTSRDRDDRRTTCVAPALIAQSRHAARAASSQVTVYGGSSACGPALPTLPEVGPSASIGRHVSSSVASPHGAPDPHLQALRSCPSHLHVRRGSPSGSRLTARVRRERPGASRMQRAWSTCAGLLHPSTPGTRVRRADTRSRRRGCRADAAPAPTATLHGVRRRTSVVWSTSCVRQRAATDRRSLQSHPVRAGTDLVGRITACGPRPDAPIRGAGARARIVRAVAVPGGECWSFSLTVDSRRPDRRCRWHSSNGTCRQLPRAWSAVAGMPAVPLHRRPPGAGAAPSCSTTAKGQPPNNWTAAPNGSSTW